MEDNENDELFICPICCEIFKIPIMLDCGHVFCKKCIFKILEKEKEQWKCPNCNKEINKDNMREVKQLENIIKFYDLLNKCCISFINFPLNFKYCIECEVFITNYSFKKHKNEKHNLLTFDKILQLYFEEKKIIFDKNMFMVIYFYLNPNLHEMKYLKEEDDKRNVLYFGNDELIFYKKMVNHYENKFLMDLMSNQINKNDCAKWFRGTLIHRKNSFFIHGYFLIKIIKGQLDIFHNIFGFLNYKEVSFFGLIKLNKNSINKTEPLKIEDFIFHCGLLYNKHYYFGEFNEINISKLLINENNDVNNIKKGEVLYLKEKGIEVKIIKTEKKELETPRTKNKLNHLNNLCIFFEYKGISLQIEIKPFYIQKDKNGNNQPFEEYKLINCKINFINYKRTLIFDKNEYSIYIFKNEEKKAFHSGIIKTKVICINLNEDIILYSQVEQLLIKNLNNENIENKRNFCNNLKNLLDKKIENCFIKYYIGQIINGDININKDNYYEISGCDVIQKIKGINMKDRKIYYKDNFLRQIDIIEDFFKYELTSDIYHFKDKKKDEIICNVCDII